MAKKWKKSINIILCFCLFPLTVIFIIMQKQPIPPSQNLIVGTSASISTALLAIAKDQNFYEQEGLNVQIRLYKSAALAFDDMLAGNIPIAGTAETPIVYKSFENKEFRIFATACTSGNDPKVIARSDHGIHSPLDLSGKLIASTKKGQSAHFFLYLFMLKYGINEEDITIIHDSPKKIVELLSAGEIDAASLFEPYASFAEKEIGDKALVFAEPGIYLKSFNLTAKSEFLKNKQEAVKQFLKALLRAEKFAMKYPEETIKIIAENYSVDKDIVRKYLKSSSLDVMLSPYLIITMKDEAKWAMKNYLTGYEHIPDFSNLIYTDTLELLKPDRMTIIKPGNGL